MDENDTAKQNPAARLTRAQDRELHWRKHVETWRTSGLTQAAYSREHGLAPADLSWWKHDLARRDLKRKAERAPAKPNPMPARTKRAFIPVRVSSSAQVAGGFEVVLREGQTIRMAAGFDETGLRRLIAVLENSKC